MRYINLRFTYLLTYLLLLLLSVLCPGPPKVSLSKSLEIANTGFLHVYMVYTLFLFQSGKSDNVSLRYCQSSCDTLFVAIAAATVTH